jgi:SPP1 gp7 family putative phage head morphogenesis protein
MGQLGRVAKAVGDLVAGWAGGAGPGEERQEAHSAHLTELSATLRRYADVLLPWARKVAERMILDVAKRDEQAWIKMSASMGRELAKEIRGAPTGEVMRARLAEQVDLITSLPRGAAERVHRLAIQGISEGTRATEIAAKILETGKVTKSRAMLIARTEVARTASELTEARAQHVGSEGYIWRTAGDSDVRPLHARLEGRFIRWDDPPTIDDGIQAHAGCIWNCRCYPEPVIPDVV